MLAHYHGQVWNASEFARAFGVSDMTVRRYLDVLAATFAVRVLQPWHENLGKRQLKSPKVYLADPGVLHALLGIERREDLVRAQGTYEAIATSTSVAPSTLTRSAGATPSRKPRLPPLM